MEKSQKYSSTTFPHGTAYLIGKEIYLKIQQIYHARIIKTCSGNLLGKGLNYLTIFNTKDFPQS